ncbi:MAG: HPr family phosphocarrier protein [Lachnospiraceae bacterium]|nr:HPr family phosphocarrier protein [Lachnospiraceae bacterium]
MKTVKISIDSYTKIQNFTRIVNDYHNDFDLVQGRYVINAKSTMGILSLDISKPIDLNIRDAGSQLKEILTTLEPFIVDEESEA